ncbi:Deoxyuridine 5'-triphosphate nucleotidohydrolase [compost metagenome]
MIEVKILDDRLKPEMLVPSTEGSAAIDLRACTQANIYLQPNETFIVGTGLSFFIKDRDKAGIVLPRSGLGTKGLVVGNLVGLIDSDYQGEISISLWNRSNSMITISPLDRVAQFMIIPVIHPEYKVVEAFEQQTKRGTGGHGSTGIS